MAGYIGNSPTPVPLTSADLADNIITSAKIVDGAIVNTDINASAGIVTSKLSGALGITMADQWRLSADYTYSSPGDLTANLERVDSTNQGTLGTGMTESSGVFTFPSTGYYLVRFSVQQYKIGDRRDIAIKIQTTADNSSYVTIAHCKTHITETHTGGTTYIQGMTETLLDITDTSNQKVKFNVFTDATTAGDTTENQTFMTFLRIGDT